MLSRLRRFKQRRPIFFTLAVIALVFSPCWAPLGLLVGYATYVRQFVWTDEDRAHQEYEGLPSDARKWRAVIEAIPDPDTAERDHLNFAHDRDYFSLRFPNGEWVFGIAVQSHKFVTKGGTVVLKDSRGQVSIYYGHVCSHGGDYMYPYGERTQNLDEFYSRMREWKNFTEQALAP